eukprot:TRINITY_DN56722_c0_g1_i1.p1 TRINITY_DN56722_c0_g1~~TRINITY_DN56722_c0_g1_i1.p1  ORF type:complete len:175 (-),score=6.01 TRINITY_DN56722_c0_g1_i1:129-581(-)
MRLAILFTSILMLGLAPTSSSASDCPDPLTKSFYLSLSNNALFAYGVRKDIGAGCRISLGNSRAHCDLYVKSATVGNQGYRGWPRNRDGLGTGCVMAPEFPKRRTYCYAMRSEYDHLPMLFRESMCTDSGLNNAANVLRDAIEKNQCGLC